MLVRTALQNAMSQKRNSAQLKANHESSSISLEPSWAMNQKPGFGPSRLSGREKPLVGFGPGALQCKPGALRPNLSGNAIQRSSYKKMTGVTRAQVAEAMEVEEQAEAESSRSGIYSGNILDSPRERKSVIGFDPSGGLGYKKVHEWTDEFGTTHRLPILAGGWPPYIDFKNYVIQGGACKIQYQGSRSKDYAEAERITKKACGVNEVWHHASDYSGGYGTMQLLPKYIHKCPHSGGVEQAQSSGDFFFYH